MHAPSEILVLLAGVARHRDAQLETCYFGCMPEMHQACPSRFAADRFPAFGGQAPAGHAH